MLYSAADIIDKTLIAKENIAIKRLPLDSAPTVFTVQSGQPVGRVNSWLSAGAGRSTLYWMFLDSNGRPYYAAHTANSYSLSAIKQQGVVSVKEAAEAAAAKTETTSDFLKKYAKTALYVVAAAVVLKSVLPELIKRK
jgi:hypothetical protein